VRKPVVERLLSAHADPAAFSDVTVLASFLDSYYRVSLFMGIVYVLLI
jgi:hypothetical protein